jgi:hypothetical protein
MASLEDLARKRFTDPPLSEAEERVVRAASDGIMAYCLDLGGGDDPEEGRKWPDARKVRADLIRWLCIYKEARDQVDPRGVWILGALIMEAVDLSFTTMTFPLALLRCRLDQHLILQGAKMITLSLDGSWTGPIFADGLDVEGSLFMRNDFHAEGVVKLPGASIKNNLEATGGTFNNPTGYALFADHINVRGSVLMKPKFNEQGEMQHAFVAAGEVRLLGAAIGNNLDAEGATFNNPNGIALIADIAKIEGSVFLTGGFSAEGEVRLVNATVGGDLNATGGTFKEPNGKAVLCADSASLRGNVFLKGGFTAAGHVRLPGAEIGGQLVVDDARLDALILESARVAGPFLWRNIHKESDPRFPNKEWKPFLNLTNAKVESLLDQEASWPPKGRLFLDGFVYDRITMGPTDANTRLRWLRLQPDELGYLPQPYEQLIAVLREMGHEHQVAKVAIAKKWDLRKRGHLGWLGWIQNWFLYLVVGYWYRPWPAFVWISLLVVLGSCVFSRAYSAGLMVPSDKDAYAVYENSKIQEVRRPYPRFHALLYSLDVILPSDLGQKSNWRLIERWPDDRAYLGFELYWLFQLLVAWGLLLVAAVIKAGFVKED